MATEAVQTLERAQPLSSRNFNRLSELIQSYSGIKMPPNKRTMLEGRLRRRLRATAYRDVNDYCRYLFEEDGLEAEIVHLIDAVTTNKTEFFREPAHFHFLETRALPELAKAGRRDFKVWSAACSTGAEPYTLAMVLSEFCAERRGFDLEKHAVEAIGKALKARGWTYERTTTAAVELPSGHHAQIGKPGRPDLYVYPGNGLVVFLEVKSRTGSTSEAQDRWHERARARGYVVEVVRTPEEAYRCFMRTGMDVLVLGSFVLRKEDQPEYAEAVDWREQIPLD